MRLSIVPPNPKSGYHAVAHNMLRGVRVLAQGRGAHDACALVAGQGLECALKAFLALSGVGEAMLRKKPFGHNLVALWTACGKRGLFAETPPHWVRTLTEIYDQPSHLRYMAKVHGYTLPGKAAMLEGLSEVLSAVDAKFRGE